MKNHQKVIDILYRLFFYCEIKNAYICSKRLHVVTLFEQSRASPQNNRRGAFIEYSKDKLLEQRKRLGHAYFFFFVCFFPFLSVSFFFFFFGERGENFAKWSDTLAFNGRRSVAPLCAAAIIITAWLPELHETKTKKKLASRYRRNLVWTLARSNGLAQKPKKKKKRRENYMPFHTTSEHSCCYIKNDRISTW